MFNFVPNCSRQQAVASVGPTVVSVLNTEVLTWRNETRELKARLIFALKVPETPLAREAKVDSSCELRTLKAGNRTSPVLAPP
jgi:hypothetical protein